MNPNELPITAESCADRGKATYVRPVLQVYGSVAEFTKGSRSHCFDGTNSRKKSLAASCGSDPAIKQNIVRIGDHPKGFALYLFDYKVEFQGAWGRGRQFGVMADEVELVMPEAVSFHPDGYKMVNYGLLGISRHLD